MLSRLEAGLNLRRGSGPLRKKAVKTSLIVNASLSYTARQMNLSL